MRVAAALMAAGAVAGSGTAQATVTLAWASTDADPHGMVIDAAGNLYVATYGGDTMTQVAPDGASIAFPAGDGPSATAIAPDGFVYTANTNDDTISKFNEFGSLVVTWAVLPPGSRPYGIVVGPTGDIYTANQGTNTVSRISPTGTVTPAFGVTGNGPEAITVDAVGNLYTANTSADTVSKITPAGVSTVAWAALPSNAGPEGISVDLAGNVYTAGYNHGQINKITPDGTVSLLATLPTQPWGITVDSAGNVYTADNYDPAAFPNGGVTKIAPDGTWVSMGLAGGGPYGIVIDGLGNLFVSNSSNNFGIGNSITKISPGGGTPDTAPAPPAAPAPPVATAGERSAVVTVTPNPISARSGAPTSYVVRVVGDPSKSCTVTVPDTSCTVTGLTAGRDYRFEAIAVLNISRTQPSSESNAVVPTAGPIPAAGPTPAASALRATVRVSRRLLVSGQSARLVITASNTQATTVSGVTSCLAVPANLVVTRAPGGTRSKGRVCFSIGGLAAGAKSSRAVTVRAVAAHTVRRSVGGAVTAPGRTAARATPVVIAIRPHVLVPVVTG